MIIPPHFRAVRDNAAAKIAVEDFRVVATSIKPLSPKIVTDWEKKTKAYFYRCRMNTTKGKDKMKRIKNVETLDDFVLRVTFKDDQSFDVNLSELIRKSKRFKRFEEHPEEFQEVSVVASGIGIEWENGLDYSSESLWKLAELQSPLEAQYFV